MMSFFFVMLIIFFLFQVSGFPCYFEMRINQALVCIIQGKVLHQNTYELMILPLKRRRASTSKTNHIKSLSSIKVTKLQQLLSLSNIRFFPFLFYVFSVITGRTRYPDRKGLFNTALKCLRHTSQHLLMPWYLRKFNTFVKKYLLTVKSGCTKFIYCFFSFVYTKHDYKPVYVVYLKILRND